MGMLSRIQPREESIEVSWRSGQGSQLLKIRPQTRHLSLRWGILSRLRKRNQRPISQRQRHASNLTQQEFTPPTETGAEDTQGTLAGSAEGVTGEVVTGGISKPVPGRGVDIATGSRKEKHIPSIDASRKSKL